MNMMGIDYGDLERVYYCKFLGIVNGMKYNINQLIEKRFLPIEIESVKEMKTWVNVKKERIYTKLKVIAKTYCPICEKWIRFEGVGVVSIDVYFLIYSEKIEDLKEDDIKRFVTCRAPYVLAIALSSIILKRHLNKNHDVRLRTVKKNTGNYIVRRSAVGTSTYGISYHVYQCPFCNKELNGLKQAVLHILEHLKKEG